MSDNWDEDEAYESEADEFVILLVTTWLNLSRPLPAELREEIFEVYEKDGDVFVIIPRTTFLLLSLLH